MGDVPLSKRQSHFPKREPLTVSEGAPEDLRRFLQVMEIAAHDASSAYRAVYTVSIRRIDLCDPS
jgi:hypothetical protein